MTKNKKEKLSEERKKRIANLQNMFKEKFFKSSFVDKIDELIKLLTPFGETGLPLDEATKAIDLNEQGLREVISTTHSKTLEIFSKEKGEKQFWYVKVKKKQP